MAAPDRVRLLFYNEGDGQVPGHPERAALFTPRQKPVSALAVQSNSVLAAIGNPPSLPLVQLWLLLLPTGGQ